MKKTVCLINFTLLIHVIDREVEVDEEGSMPEDLLSNESWIHLPANILIVSKLSQLIHFAFRLEEPPIFLQK
jgi:hypothetical protein